jgi:8-oxo-dGTP pyrophosphatase MutT (NUDIX family)
MPGQMIHYGDDRGHFLYRVAAVAIRDGRVLVHRFEYDTFYCLPGGRVEMGEPAEEALYREMREELGCDVTITRLLWVVDNHFVHRGHVYHELGLYFAVTLPDGPQSCGDPWIGEELNGTKMHFHWQPVEQLGELEFNPPCLVGRMASLPEWPEYVLQKDGDQGR